MKVLLSITLFFAVVATAIEVVTVQHVSREHFVDIQQLEMARDELDEEWGKLQLEQSTWATEDRIEKIAREKLHMHEPSDGSLFYLVP